ncbi:shikimate kinase [Algoriphagus machipongonensis]|uniref:Shikimate kinase n=1 Tax=Algoriphagus machipongonensis TaxID=388413 RepID=A3I109_9BACT|nr:shikimate kinase [Algoriphagus machipongonensis]EAZ80155.1 shikimate kinase [Algoriphagus machipongonensis]
MNDFLKVVLVGLPGSGKSTFGRQLATALDFPYYDLDQLIEKKFQMKIPDIFNDFGEGRFREWETETLIEVMSSQESLVLASGGGCPCFNDNMDIINKQGASVYLDVPLEEISERLSLPKLQHRPMFKDLGHGEITLKLKSLLADREFYYDQAKIKLSGGDFSTELLMSELIKLIKN